MPLVCRKLGVLPRCSLPNAILAAAFLLGFFFMCVTHGAGAADGGLAEIMPHMVTTTGAFGVSSEDGRTLVIYVYHGVDEEDADNLRYFLSAGVAEDDGNDYVIIAQRREQGQEQEGAAIGLPLPSLPELPPSVRVVARPAVPCSSAYGVLGWALDSADIQFNAYNHFIMLDSSVRGPFLPTYWPVSEGRCAEGRVRSEIAPVQPLGLCP